MDGSNWKSSVFLVELFASLGVLMEHVCDGDGMHVYCDGDDNPAFLVVPRAFKLEQVAEFIFKEE